MVLDWSTSRSVLTLLERRAALSVNRDPLEGQNGSDAEQVESEAEALLSTANSTDNHNDQIVLSCTNAFVFPIEIKRSLEEVFIVNRTKYWMILEGLEKMLYSQKTFTPQVIVSYIKNSIESNDLQESKYTETQEIYVVHNILRTMMKEEGLAPNKDQKTTTVLLSNQPDYSQFLAPDRVYTWEAALKIIKAIEKRLTKRVGREIHFDEKHIQYLNYRFQEEGFGFWSVLDQMQARMTELEWSDVRCDARFIHSFINKFKPNDAQLSSFMQQFIPRHHLVKPHVPPHVFFHSINNDLVPKKDQQIVHKSSEEEDIYSWEIVQYVLLEVENTISSHANREIHFDDRHKDYIHQKWMREPYRIYAHIDQLVSQLFTTDWNKVRDNSKFIHSLLGYPLTSTGTSTYSPFLTGILTSSAVATLVSQCQTMKESSYRPLSAPPTYSPQIDSEIQTQSKTQYLIPQLSSPHVFSSFSNSLEQSKMPSLKSCLPMLLADLETDVNAHFPLQTPVTFDSKHIEYLERKYDSNPRKFFSLINETYKKMLSTNWPEVKHPNRYIQSIISRQIEEEVIPCEFVQSLFVKYRLALAARTRPRSSNVATNGSPF